MSNVEFIIEECKHWFEKNQIFQIQNYHLWQSNHYLYKILATAETLTVIEDYNIYTCCSGHNNCGMQEHFGYHKIYEGKIQLVFLTQKSLVFLKLICLVKELVYIWLTMQYLYRGSPGFLPACMASVYEGGNKWFKCKNLRNVYACSKENIFFQF